jgi:hypothetical protein
MEFKVEADSKRIQRVFKRMMSKAIQVLGLEKSQAAVFVKFTHDTVPEIAAGYTQYLDGVDCYMIVIKPPPRLTHDAAILTLETLVHEMIHVRQMIRGLLKHDDGKIWRGKRYPNKKDFRNRR